MFTLIKSFAFNFASEFVKRAYNFTYSEKSVKSFSIKITIFLMLVRKRMDEIVNLDLEDFLGRLIITPLGEFILQHKT